MNKFISGKLYTHNRMLDLNVKVRVCHVLDRGGYSLLVSWINKRGMYLGITEDIFIASHEVRNWRKV